MCLASYTFTQRYPNAAAATFLRRPPARAICYLAFERQDGNIIPHHRGENKGEFEIEGISCPGGWAVYRTAVGQHHDIRQLALRRKIARNLRVVGSVILQIRWSINSRIEYENRFLQFEPHDIDRRDVIGISRHKLLSFSCRPPLKTARASHLSA